MIIPETKPSSESLLFAYFYAELVSSYLSRMAIVPNNGKVVPQNIAEA